jgi:hypothetical protein
LLSGDMKKVEAVFGSMMNAEEVAQLQDSGDNADELRTKGPSSSTQNSSSAAR